MNIQINRAGTWQEVSQSELIELVRAEIGAGKKAVLRRIDGQ
ncbi:MAG: hypothetical protein ACRC46_05455 [Thermoguttaceae bacterium]